MLCGELPAMTHPLDSDGEDRGFEAEAAPEPAASLPAGAIRLPRSPLVLFGILGVGLVIAAAGLMTGMSHSRRTDLDNGDGIKIENGGTVAAKPLASTPVMPLAGAEPGSDAIGPVSGDATQPSSAPPGTVLSTPSQPTTLVAPSGSPAKLVSPHDAAEDDGDTPRQRPDAGAKGASAEGGIALQCLAPLNRVQSVICSDARLSAVDLRMRRAFRRALSESDDPDALQAEQARWRAARDRAALQGDAGALAELYSARIHELEPQ
jgi:hypothetical protein